MTPNSRLLASTSLGYLTTEVSLNQDNRPVTILQGLLDGEEFRFTFTDHKPYWGEVSFTALQSYILSRLKAPFLAIPTFVNFVPSAFGNSLWTPETIEGCHVKAYLTLAFTGNEGIPFVPTTGFNPYLHAIGRNLPPEWIDIDPVHTMVLTQQIKTKTQELVEYHRKNFAVYQTTSMEDSYHADWKP